MPTFKWKGQILRAPSLEAVQKYIKSQQTAAVRTYLDTPEKPKGDTSSMWTPPKQVASKMEPYRSSIEAAEQQYEIPSTLLARVLYQESRFRPDIIEGKTKSSAGAIGIAQFMPATAAELGIDPTKPHEAIDAAGKYLSQLRKRSDNWAEALAKYNWGMGNFAKKGGLEGAPKETRDYYTQILADVGEVDGG